MAIIIQADPNITETVPFQKETLSLPDIIIIDQPIEGFGATSVTYQKPVSAYEGISHFISGLFYSQEPVIGEGLYYD